MNIRAIATEETRAAVNNVKKKVSKKFDLGVSLSIPKELAEKREYMQTDKFLNDKHNQIMFDVIDEMMKYRDQIGKDLSLMSKSLRTNLCQAVNGFIRLKSDLKQDYSKNFSNDLTLKTEIEEQYRLLKNLLLKTLSENAFK